MKRQQSDRKRKRVFATSAANDMGKVSGALVGVFDPSADAQKLLGQLDMGKMFVYMFRRFGYPQYSWDSYKQLIGYYLTTPMPGVFLSVSPQNCESFGYMLSPELARQCSEEEQQPFKDYHYALRRWARRKHRVALVSRWIDDTAYINRVYSKWIRLNYPAYSSEERAPERIETKFLNEKEREYKRYEALYREKHAFPQSDQSDVIDLTVFPEGSLRAAIHEALCEAINDLRRPVSIRDWELNVFGDVTGTGGRKPAEPSATSGYGVCVEAYEDPVLYSKFLNAVKARGEGSILKGMTAWLESVAPPTDVTQGATV